MVTANRYLFEDHSTTLLLRPLVHNNYHTYTGKQLRRSTPKNRVRTLLEYTIDDDLSLTTLLQHIDHTLESPFLYLLRHQVFGLLQREQVLPAQIHLFENEDLGQLHTWIYSRYLV